MPKIMSERAASKATPAKVIKYIMDENKCCVDENGEIIMSTYGLDDSRPYSQQFKETAELAGNSYGQLDRKYYHFKMTFHADDAAQNGGIVTPQMALEMAEKWQQENFPDHQAVITVQYHNNPEAGNDPHLHVHIVINASSFDCEKNKIKLSNKDLDTLRDSAFEIGKEYGLEENYWRDEVARKLDQHRNELENRPNNEPVYLSDGEKNVIAKYGKNFADHSFKEKYRIAIDEAKLETGSREGFQMYLKEHFDIDTKITEQGNIKYKLPDRRTYTTGKSLGTLYELPAIDAALAKNENRFENELRSEIEKEKDYSPTPTIVEQQVADFRQAFADFKAWKDGEYTLRRDAWQKETDRKAADTKEYYLNKSVLENGQLAFYAAIEKLTNELREKSETEAYEKEMEALKEQAAELQKQQGDIMASFGASEEDAKSRTTPSDRDQQREAYVETLMTVGTSLDAKIRAAEGIREMNIEDGQGKSPEYTAMEHYGRDTRTFDVANDPKPQRDWRAVKLQAMMDSITLSRELGANTAAEFKLAVDQKGRELGALRKELRAAEKGNDFGKIDRLEKEVEKAKNDYARYARALKQKEIFEEKYIQLGGIEGMQRENDRQTAVDLEKRISYLQKRQEHLRQQAKTMNNICRNMRLSLSDVLTDTDRAEQYDGFVSRRNDAYDQLSYNRAEIEKAKKQLEELHKKAEKELRSAGPEPVRRSKDQAIKAKNEQNAELRDWIDEAMGKIGVMPNQSREADMKTFAEEMQRHGCTVRVTDNTISVKHPQSNQPIRTNRLGEDYSKGAIENGIFTARQQTRTNQRHDHARTAGRERTIER